MFAVGDQVQTDWNGRFPTIHTIKAVHVNANSSQKMSCQSGVLVQVKPALKDLTEIDWIDIGWFKKTGE